MNRLFSTCVVVIVVGLSLSGSSVGGEGNAYEQQPQGYRRPSFYGYYPNGGPYQNYPYYQTHGETFYYHQPYYHARPAYGGGFYHPGTWAPSYGRRAIGRGL